MLFGAAGRHPPDGWQMKLINFKERERRRWSCLLTSLFLCLICGRRQCFVLLFSCPANAC